MSETKPITVYKREGMFIPMKSITPRVKERVQTKLTHQFYEEKACKDCENLPDRHNDLCDSCPAYKGGYMLAPVVKVKDNRYMKVPVGSWDRTRELLERMGYEVTVKDKTPRKDIEPIAFLGKFREGQREAVRAMLKYRRGVIKAPPRSGKTVSSTAYICQRSKKTLIIASQKDWLMGFKETFVGSRTQKALTDIDPKRIKLCKTYEDFKTHDICLATVQTFYSDAGLKLLKRISSMFEIIVGDEIHYGAADKFIQILNQFNVHSMIGLSATPSRKDMKFVLVREVVGPTIHEVKVATLRPTIRLTKTAYTKTYKGNAMWATMVKSLSCDKKRLLLIAKMCLKDVADGHMVFIPFAQIKPIDALVETINRLAGEDIAHAFTGREAKIREDLIQKARRYKIKVFVGQMRILSTGINVPRASAIYEVELSSNKENAEQRMMRVLTAYDGKPPPLIRYFLDDMNVRRNCLRNEWFNVVKPKLKPIISERDETLLKLYFNQRSTNGSKHFGL